MEREHIFQVFSVFTIRQFSRRYIHVYQDETDPPPGVCDAFLLGPPVSTITPPPLLMYSLSSGFIQDNKQKCFVFVQYTQDAPSRSLFTSHKGGISV